MLAALTLVSLLVAPEGAPVVRWSAPSQCPAAEAVEAAVAAYVGRPLGDEAVHAEARVTASADGFALALTIRRGDEADERALADPNCAVLADAAALMVAVAIDPDAAAKSLEELDPLGARTPSAGVVESGATGSEGGTVIEPPADDEGEAVGADETTDARDGVTAEKSGATDRDEADETTRARPEDDRASCRPGPMKGARPSCGAVGAALPLQLGPLPRFGPGLGGHAALLWPRVRLELGGAFFFTQAERLDADPERGGDIRLGVGHVRSCGRLGWRTLEFPLCGGIEAGAMHGTGIGIDNAQTDRIPWFAALADAAFVYSPARIIALTAQVGTVIPFATYRFRADTLGTIHQATPLGLRLSLAAELRF